MALLPRDSRMTRVKTGEIRITLIGNRPHRTARMAFMGEDGSTYGETMLHVFSPATNSLIDELAESIENDLVGMLGGTPVIEEEEGDVVDRSPLTWGGQ